MALTPKSRSGPNGSLGVKPPALRGLPRSTRKRQATESTEYSRAKLREVQNRCELYSLKLTELKANLLDRTEVLTAFSEITSAIKQVIAQSPLSRTEKKEVFANLLTPEEFVSRVTRQSAEGAKGEVIGNGIDHAIDEI